MKHQSIQGFLGVKLPHCMVKFILENLTPNFSTKMPRFHSQEKKILNKLNELKFWFLKLHFCVEIDLKLSHSNLTFFQNFEPTLVRLFPFCCSSAPLNSEQTEKLTKFWFQTDGRTDEQTAKYAHCGPSKVIIYSERFLTVFTAYQLRSLSNFSHSVELKLIEYLRVKKIQRNPCADIFFFLK